MHRSAQHSQQRLAARSTAREQDVGARASRADDRSPRDAAQGNCLYATRDFAPGAAVTDERPLVRSRLDDDPALTERVESAHRRSPFGFQHMRSHLAALWTLQSAPPHVIDAIAAKAAPTAPAAAARLDEELAAVTTPWHARYVGVVLDAASVSSLHEAVPPRHPTVTDQKHLTLCFEPTTTAWLPLLGTRCALRVSMASQAV